MNDNYTNDRYSEILQKLHKIRKVRSFKQGMLAGHACRLLSPYCSALFIKRGYTPNQVTLFMIAFGVVGSIFFALPYGWAKIVGYIFWYLWFTMDLSDGEVARYTQQFSKYGTEMDYMAHLIDHPLMNIALWLTFLEMNVFDTNFLAITFIVSISMELVCRNITAFQHYRLKESQVGGQKPQEVSGVRYLLIQMTLYPNFIIVLTPIIIIDYFLGFHFSLYLYIVWTIYCLIMFIRTLYKTLYTFYIGKD